jgi:hypothetical protein
MKNLFSLLILLLATGCSSVEEEISPLTQTPVGVYIAGQKNNHACYWKNNQEYILTDDGFLDSEAHKIIVSNNNIYVLGKSSDGTSLFWKNNVITNLSVSLSTLNHAVDNIGDMAINGDDVYFSGQMINSDLPVETFHMSYWKNGEQNIIAETLSYFVVNNLSSYIKVLNNNVIMGYEYGYSINSEIQNQNSEGCKPKGIAIKNHEAYIYGTNHMQNKAYYKNVLTQDETTVNLINEGHKLVFDLSDTYISNGSSVFKNNTIINSSSFFSFYLDFSVLNNNVYILKRVGGGTTDVLYINDVNVFEIFIGDGNFNSITVVQNPI